MSEVNLIGLIGPKFSGKSTLAQELVTTLNFIRLPFAKHLKDMLRTFLTNQGLSPEEVIEWIDGNLKETPCPYIENKTPRFAMQTLGTEWGRDLISQNLWINSWRRSAEVLLQKQLKVVCDDVRFKNEGELIQSLGGKLIFIHRKGTFIGEHHSEKEFLELTPDLHIHNSMIINSRYEGEQFGKNNLFYELQNRWHTKYGEYL